MKPRRVMLMVEVETSLPLKGLKNHARAAIDSYGLAVCCEVHQVQANVIKDKPKGKRK